MAEFVTAGGIVVRRDTRPVDAESALEPVVTALDERLGMVLASDTEYPGRYTRWEAGFVDPPLRVTARERQVRITALNERGAFLLARLEPALRATDDVAGLVRDPEGAGELVADVAEPAAGFAEEDRSRQPSVISVVRAIRDFFRSPADAHLGLYGCFGYDLAFQFEPATLRLPRRDDRRDLVLYLPDELVVVDRQRGVAHRHSYEFRCGPESTAGLGRGGPRAPWIPGTAGDGRDMPPGAYADLVQEAKKAFECGDLFEVVLSQTFTRGARRPPSELFRRLRANNPSPYGLLVNLGDGEFLVGTSPEMYVRVSGRRLETCPLSGTVARGGDAMADADQILTLLNSAKDESELTMCTDVDRNDKARICEPGSVRVIGRRQIELYSRVIHTADHVEGMLLDGRDGLDALLAHTWAVTVTGAPKAWAMRFVEDHEGSARDWYGGAFGFVGFDGNVDTGLAIRLIRLRPGVAEVRVGATLLFDSVPEQEERETEVKASALLDSLGPERAPTVDTRPARSGRDRRPRLILADHQDSFVHTLADCFRQAGADVRTLRAPVRGAALADAAPDLVVLSPGPGRPADFDISATLSAALGLGLPVFGVCLGLQAIVEFFGGSLAVLPEPVHGKPSPVNVTSGRLLGDLPGRFTAGRYHSLFAATVPDCLEVTARNDEGIVMAVEHRQLPVAGVQFHPESIMSLRDRIGHRVAESVLGELCPAERGERDG